MRRDPLIQNDGSSRGHAGVFDREFDAIVNREFCEYASEATVDGMRRQTETDDDDVDIRLLHWPMSVRRRYEPVKKSSTTVSCAATASRTFCWRVATVFSWSPVSSRFRGSVRMPGRASARRYEVGNSSPSSIRQSRFASV